MNTLKNISYAVVLLAVMALGCLAQTQMPAPADAKQVSASGKLADKPVDTLKPVTLTAAQLTQLQEAQKALELAKAKASEAAAQLEKLQCQVEAFVMAIRWELGVNPKQYKPGLQVVDEQTGALGFVPLSKQ